MKNKRCKRWEAPTLLYLKRAILLITCLLFAAVPFCASAQTPAQKEVRVGWYDSPFNYIGDNGRRSGHGYVYQQKNASYTGWKYKYVEGSWPELLEKLKNGEIDLMTDVSYTKERESQMLFSSYPMGAESYYIFAVPDNPEISASEPATLDGKRVGVNQNSFQEGLLRDWAAKNGIELEIVELTSDESESVEMLKRGELDALVTIDAFGEFGSYVPYFKIGESEFFFAVNNDRKDLLKELNNAMRKIQEENPSYNKSLYDSFFRNLGTNAFLPSEGMDWLERNGKIRVGYLDKYLPFCDTDPETGALRGALREFLNQAAHAAQNAEVEFTTTAYPTVRAALDAMERGEIDCVFPVNLSAFDEEERNISATDSLIQTEIYALVRKNDHLRELSQGEMNVAIDEGDVNGEIFAAENFPHWTVVSSSGQESGYKAVEKKEADCLLLSNFLIPATEPLREQYSLTPVPTGNAMYYSFAVRRTDGHLCMILNKLIGLVPETSVESAALSYSWPESRFSLMEYLREHIQVVFVIVLSAAALVVLLLTRRAENMKRELEERIALQNQLLEQERQRRQSDNMITALSADYRSVFYINLDRDEAVCYRADPKSGNGFRVGESFPFRERFEAYANEVVAPEDREEFLHLIEPENIREVLKRETVIAHRYLTVKNGEEHYELVRIAGILSEKEGIFELGMGFSDVDRKTREEIRRGYALRTALTEAEEANKAKTTFLSNMSHEIRTPMNAIIGLDTLALRDETLSPQTRDYLSKIGVSARHLLELINDILDMSRIESGRLTLRREVFSFSSMLEQINTMVMSQCSEKGLTYECRLLSRVDDSYIGDDTKLKEVLINILSNAIKFTDAPGSVTLSVERIAVFEEHSTLCFRVRDTGIGMEKEFIPKIFDTFSQENSSRKNKYGSTGLGMAITKSIVEMMNGTIRVESEKGVGTEFTVTITLTNCERPSEDREKVIDPHKMRVLVVDDDEIAAEQAKVVLDEAGIRTDVCGSGAEALRMVEIQHTKLEPYHLVLMDWKMPGMNGLEATEEIRKRYSNETTVVVLTAYNWDEILEEAHRVGVDSFLSKPVFAANVLEEYERIVRRNHLNPFQEKKQADLAGRRVLLAEDMEINAEIMMDILDMEEMVVDHAENGKIAVEMFQNSAVGTYSAVLMDVRMPEMDGLEATAAIRALDREDAKRVPIIALTANAFDEDVKHSLQAGMNSHLNKPVDPDLLFQVLGSLIYEAEQSR